MAQAGRIVALGLTLVVGGLAGYTVATVGEPPRVEVASSAPAQTVTQTVQAEPVTVTVEPQPTDDPNGPKANGNYLVGAELAAGTWQCDEGDDLTSWFARDRDGSVTPNWGTGTLAVIPADAYIADMLGCSGTWSLVG